MEKLYILSELSIWENDLLQAQNNDEQEPSSDVINTIIEYSLTKEFYSPTLKKSIALSIN